MKISQFVKSCGVATVATLLLAPAAFADSGFFIGGSIGDTTIDDGAGFDESDSSYKVMVGYIFDMPAVDFGIEAAYVDFGAPSGDVFQVPAEIDVTALTAFGTVGLDWGLFGIFAKAGFVSWDADLEFGGLQGSDDGTDPAYGVGFRLGFSSIEVRAEYEVFDIADTDSVDMLSLGVIWRF